MALLNWYMVALLSLSRSNRGWEHTRLSSQTPTLERSFLRSSPTRRSAERIEIKAKPRFSYVRVRTGPDGAARRGSGPGLPGGRPPAAEDRVTVVQGGVAQRVVAAPVSAAALLPGKAAAGDHPGQR